MESRAEREHVPFGTTSRINWGAIIGGAIIGIFFQTLLGLLGLAIGVTAFRPGEPITLQTGIAAGTYLLVISVISVFLGAFAAGRFAGFVSRYDGVFHGVATLSLLTVISLLTISSAIGAIGITYGNTMAEQVQAGRLAQMPPPLGGKSLQQTTGAAAPMTAQESLQAKKNMASASWTAFMTAAFSLIAAIIGGVLGIRSRVKGMRKDIIFEK